MVVDVPSRPPVGLEPPEAATPLISIEGGAVDWASHDTYSGRMIEEEVDFEAAFTAVVDWVEAHSNWGETLVVVIADHETRYLNGPGSDPTWMPIVNDGAGLLPGMERHSFDHTNSLVPFLAKGDAARMFQAVRRRARPGLRPVSRRDRDG